MFNLKTEDAKAGLMFLAVGVFFGINTLWKLDIGSLDQMGPGYFPIALCVILITLGAAIFLKAQPDEVKQLPINWRAVMFIGAAPVAFGFTVRSLGLLPALLISIGLVVMASQKISLMRRVMIVLGVTVFNIAVFKYGVGVPFPLINPSLIH